MKTIKILMIAGYLLAISACAGIPLFSSAVQEFEKGVALFNQGRYDQALPNFVKATELDAEYTEAYLYLGRSHLNLGQWRQAIQPLRTAYRRSPDETRKEAVNLLIDALLGGALAEIKAGNFQEAISYLKEGLELNPDSLRLKDRLDEALISYGSRLLSEHNFADAISVYQEAINMAPEKIAPYLGLARAFISEGEFLKALQYAKEAEALDPNSSAVRSLLFELLKGNQGF